MRKKKFPGVLSWHLVREFCKRNALFFCMAFLGVFLFAGKIRMGTMEVQAATQKTATQKKTTTKKKEVTPKEPASSDLRVVHTVTKLASKRWIQSFTMDDTYYYYIQMTKPSVGNSRITRIKYTGLGKYKKDHMDLRYFGHGTNLDCSVSGGITYLWTGSNAAANSDVSRAISGFRYRKNGVLSHNGEICYKIPKGVDGKYVTNVYPAISPDSKKIAVRFTYKKRQYFQIYNLIDGKWMDVHQLLRQVVLPATAGDFQGFDISNSTIYTIEGSPRKSFLKGYDKSRVYQPTIIRSCNYRTGSVRAKLVRGAQKLSFREPEGIKVTKNGRLQILFVSNTLTNQSCNIYELK